MTARRSTTRVGRDAEARVAAYLEARGWVVLGRNVRVGRDELDLVALEGATLVVVEVRARAPGSLVDPLATVSRAKAARLRRAALAYLATRGALDARIDVAAVTGDRVEFVENAVDFTST